MKRLPVPLSVMLTAAGVLLLVFSVALCGVSGVMLSTLVRPDRPDPHLLASAGVVLLCGGGAVSLALSGGVLLSLARKERASRQIGEREQKIVQAAQQRAYRLTVAEAAALTDLSLAEVKQYLEEQAHRGYVGVEIDEQGHTVYCFDRV